MKRFFWLASYPKSGNTWMRLALASLRAGGSAVDINRFRQAEEGIAASRQAFDDALLVDSSCLTEREILALRPQAFRVMAARLHETVIWKVHEAWLDVAPGEPLLPPEVTVGAAYLVRDPRDIAVSLAHHSGRGLDLVIADMADPSRQLAAQRRYALDQLPQPVLDWSGHVESWLNQDHFPVSLVRYEDMLADPAAALRRVALAAGCAASDHAVAGAVVATRFEELSRQEAEQGFCERPVKAERFFRQGRSGGWRDVLTREQAERIVSGHGRVMARLGYL